MKLINYSWEQRKLGDEATELLAGGDIDKAKSSENGKYPIYANALTNEGIVGYYNDFFRVKAPAVTITGRGEIGYAIARNVDFTPVVRLISIKTKHNNSFLANAINQLKVVSESTGVPQLTVPQVEKYEIKFPVEIKEEIQIAKLFNGLDSLITLHQRKLKIFCSHRFFEPVLFCYSWEQRELGDLLTIERGGSPRPIDAYLTTEENGLNWVKIGDAPEQGRYITKTEEKIKPEGLSKTRSVVPGDLILSNSMSFGKPYIMSIYGCIHDGWLLLRDTNNCFDLNFLCHLLSSDQLLSQYKSLAAGSTVNNLNKDLVSKVTINLPSIVEQKIIGNYLESLDNLITLHQRKQLMEE